MIPPSIVFIAPDEVVNEVRPDNLYEVLQLFEKDIQGSSAKQMKNIMNQVLTAVRHYTVPGWGLFIVKGKKLTKSEKLTIDELTQQVTLEQLKDALSVQQSVFDKLQVSNGIQRNYRAHLKKLLDFCDQNNWWKTKDDTNSPYMNQYHPLWKKGFNSDLIKTTCKPLKSRFGLGCVKGDTISEKLRQQMVDREDFEIDSLGNRARTAAQTSRRILQILGAEPYRQSVVSTEELNLTTMIPFVPLRTGLTTLTNSSLVDRLIRKEELMEEARQEANKAERSVRRLLRWYREERQVAPGMEQDVVVTHIHVAKFLYRDETDRLQAEDYEDIPIIVLLRKILKEVMQRVKTAAPVIDIETKWLDWPDWVRFVESLRKEATSLTYTRQDRFVNPSVLNRVLPGVAQSLQIFLLCGFWAFLPPDRQRTVRELEEGKGLIWKSDKWWIHLKPGDTKINNEEEWIPI